MEPYETFEHDGMTVEIHGMDDAENPYKSFDQASEILSDVKDYDLGEPVPHPEAWYREDPSSAVMQRYLTMFGGYALAIPFDFRDYGSGGARVHLTEPDDDPASGFLVLSREAFDKEFSAFGMALRSDDPEEHTAERTCRGEFAAFRAYVEGEVFGYVVKDPAGEVIDSCWGYYGELDYVREEAKRVAEYEAKERRELRSLPWLPVWNHARAAVPLVHAIDCDMDDDCTCGAL